MMAKLIWCGDCSEGSHIGGCFESQSKNKVFNTNGKKMEKNSPWLI
jgi:hypothetical protein